MDSEATKADAARIAATIERTVRAGTGAVTWDRREHYLSPLVAAIAEAIVAERGHAPTLPPPAEPAFDATKDALRRQLTELRQDRDRWHHLARVAAQQFEALASQHGLALRWGRGLADLLDSTRAEHADARALAEGALDAQAAAEQAEWAAQKAQRAAEQQLALVSTERNDLRASLESACRDLDRRLLEVREMAGVVDALEAHVQRSEDAARPGPVERWLRGAYRRVSLRVTEKMPWAYGGAVRRG